MRRAAERYSEPTDAERALMKDLLVELERANAATDAALVRLEATEARAAAFDADRYRAETTKRLEAAGIDWSAVAGLLGPRDRKRGVWGKRGAGREAHGGRRRLQK